MNKGFTLVELLMVVVIVGVLVLVALPKYQTAVEKGRALEGIENACHLVEYIAVHNALEENWVLDANQLAIVDKIKNKYFTISINGSNVYVTRDTNSGWDYAFEFKNDNSNNVVSCSNRNDSSDCERLDLTGNLCSSVSLD